MSLVRRHATSSGATLAWRTSGSRDTLVLTQRVTYHGFELEREEEELDVFPPGREAEARKVLASGLARGEARHPAVRRNRRAIEELRELYRRSGGTTPRLTQADLESRYEALLAGITTMDAFRSAPLTLDLWPLVGREDRERLLALPSTVAVRGKWIDVEYDLEAASSEQRTASSEQLPAIGDHRSAIPVARLRLPEKLARTLVEEELPALDRPLRFVVHRGPRGAVRAASLGELQALLDRPWSPDEAFEDRPRRRRETRQPQRREDRRHNRGHRGDRKRRRR
jgi:hypothetical protein